MNAARTLIIDLPGPDLTPEQGRFLARHGFGGACLFARNITTPERTARLVQDIRDALGHDALIATDQEGGAVLRRLDVPHVPPPMALGALRDPGAAREAGAAAARGLLDLGINWNYAPSLDVHANPQNPVIGERAFASDPALVAELGVAWAQGSEAAGVMSAVKHFPGHGDTHVDSHLDLPTVTRSRAELSAGEWVPFRAAVRAGVGSVMTAHILYPALDAERPATLSRPVLTDLLRGEWGYDGVVVTDAMDMRAIADRYPDGQGAALTLMAGADAVLNCGHGDLHTHEVHLRAIERALHRGALTEERLHEALRRLAQAQQRFPGRPRPYGAAQQARDNAQMSAWARAAVTRLGRVPRLSADMDVLLLAPEQPAVGGPYGDRLCADALAAALRIHFPRLRHAPYTDTDLGAARTLLNAHPHAPSLLATPTRWALSAAQHELARLLAPRGGVHLALWNPEYARLLPLPALITYGYRPAQVNAAAHALLTGEAPGVLPLAPLEAGANPVP
ncbi:glycoside hydrolase family 3 protein (plasmid) [Deinococcus taeanensis]|uniref:glycoside hydrolase family 3 N-terminal domain-containing protein n=1 Tax=Deinococcus taeanensis TaxID=2737050 RepID=UPI001CDC4FAB|nr:glycoside hydrolase family 3 protein [Deinococcus taeanensis]UBV44919.1 glycoside hydrolase family 3 protein [Deinococcus taeanensis]